MLTECLGAEPVKELHPRSYGVNISGYFAKVFVQEAGFVKRAAHRIIGDVGAVEEILDDVFFALYRRMQAGSAIRHVHAYLGRAAVNIAYARMRKKFIPAVELPPIEFKPALSEDAELSDRLREGIEALPEDDRAILRSVYEDGEGYTTIARHRHMDPKSIRYRAIKALGRLEGMLRPYRRVS